MSFARASASILCIRERSGAAIGLESDSLTGMGGDYTSWAWAIKANRPNLAQRQVEIEHCRAWLREIGAFAGKMRPASANALRQGAKMASAGVAGGRSRP